MNTQDCLPVQQLLLPSNQTLLATALAVGVFDDDLGLLLDLALKLGTTRGARFGLT